jgi:pimeloyl-ACP methyl ester carboxylesterase
MSAKNILYSIALLFISLTASAQSKATYGNNPATGRYYNVRGIKMYAEIYGMGKPLLLIHGNGGNISSFSKTIPYFSKKYKVIAVDSRAHGKSTDTRDSLTFEMMADDFAELLTTMHIDSAYVLGWSDGGINALLLAMRHPEKVKKLASTGANLWPDSTALIPSLWKEELKEVNTGKNKVYKTAKEKNARKVFMLDWLEPNVPITALKAIKCPSLIISGDHDLIVLQHTVEIFQHIPKAYLWILPDSGHGTLIEHADEFNKKVDDFFIEPYHGR